MVVVMKPHTNKEDIDRLAAELDQLPLGARQRAAGLFLVGAAVAASGHKGRSDSDYRNFQ